MVAAFAMSTKGNQGNAHNPIMSYEQKYKLMNDS